VFEPKTKKKKNEETDYQHFNKRDVTAVQYFVIMVKALEVCLNSKRFVYFPLRTLLAFVELLRTLRGRLPTSLSGYSRTEICHDSTDDD
jgi:hypothetical protein